MKILGVIDGSRINGIKFHRIIYPLSAMSEYFEDVNVHVSRSTFDLTEKELEFYDIILLHSTFATKEEIKRLLKFGKKVVVDYDDYWVLSTKHEMYDEWVKNKEPKRRIDMMTYDVHITVTTEALKRKVQGFALNKDVCVLPNGMIDDEEYRKPVKKDFVNFGWIGATNHITDLMMIQHLKNGYGYNVSIPEPYRKNVFKSRFNYYDIKLVPDYLNMYNAFDVILIPLDDNTFNKYKSELKLVEAGFFKKPVIVSGVQPYLPYLKDGVNCLVVKKHRHWAKYCKMLSEDADLRERLGNQLHKDMKEHFDLEKITTDRYNYFKEIIENV